MKRIRIEGGHKLQGTIRISGAKNSAVALVPASLLSDEVVKIDNIPNISDIDALNEILMYLGAKVTRTGELMTIDSSSIINKEIPEEISKKLRASYYFMSSLLGKYKHVEMYFPGGCAIGARPIDQTLKGYRALGATVKEEGNRFTIDADELHGAEVYLDMPSVGATVNTILVAVKAKGETVIENAAKEPEIIDLATFLNNMGATIRGAGTDSIRIEGVERLEAQIPHTIIPDRIEAGTYVALAACIGNGIRIHNIIEEHLDSYLAKVEEMGVVIDADEDSLYVYPAGDLKMVQVKTDVYPGFATDLQQPITPLLLTAKTGEGVVIDNIYPKRIGHIAELQKMGANIKAEDNIILAHPTKELHGAEVTAGEIRAGACLMIAGLMADGTTVIDKAGNILRGYDRIQEKLRQLGADVKIVDDPEVPGIMDDVAN